MAQDLSAFLNSVRKDLKGAAQVCNIKDVKTPFGVRIPTGIAEIDLALRGGFPAGSLHQIFGPDGVGKDFVTNLIMAQAQKMFGEATNIFWLSFGYRPDLDFMRLAGVKIAYRDDELEARGIEPETATEEQRGKDVGNIIFIDIDPEKAQENPAETLLQTAVEFIRSNHFHVGIINELGSGETRYDVEKQLGETAKIANWAKLMSDFCRKFYTALRLPTEEGEPNKTTVFMVNPVRANLDARSAKYTKYVQTSGHALRHAKAVDLHLEPGGAIREKAKKVGKEIRWKISKGKHGISEGANGTFEFFFNLGVNHIASLTQAAKSEGIIYNKGKYFYIRDSQGEIIREKLEGGLPAVITLMQEDPELTELVQAALLESARGW